LAIVLVLAVSSQSILLKTGVAKALSENASQTMLANLITKEFYEEDGSDLIEEYSAKTTIPLAQSKYLDESALVASNQGINVGVEDKNDLSGADENILVKPELATTQVSRKTRKTEVEYTVLPGDSASTIASDFDISVNTLLWENKLTAYSLIRPGDKLIILPDTGVNHKIVKGETLGALSNKYDIEAEEILRANNLADDAKLVIGQKLFIPGGRALSSPAPTKTSVAYNPLTIIKDLINPSAKNTPANKMFWPAQGRITQYFTWSHHGLDIANKQGTPIYAADAGVVEIAATGGWNSGYGNTILINHGGGKETRYGHFYKLLVKRGDKVERGQVIGLMGTTGKSTGSHLHFEVRINNKTYNPLDYIK
jgi:murein DD-endopeptidase MepM/ murein hydrolase activator NlpD